MVNIYQQLTHFKRMVLKNISIEKDLSKGLFFYFQTKLYNIIIKKLITQYCYIKEIILTY